MNELKSEFDSKVSTIFPGIKFIGRINKKGRITESCGSYAELPEEKKEMFLMTISLSHAMQRDFDEDIKPVEYVVTKRGNSKFITIPANAGSNFLVITDHDVEHEKVVAHFNRIFEQSEMFGENPQTVRGT